MQDTTPAVLYQPIEVNRIMIEQEGECYDSHQEATMLDFVIYLAESGMYANVITPLIADELV